MIPLHYDEIQHAIRARSMQRTWAYTLYGIALSTNNSYSPNIADCEWKACMQNEVILLEVQTALEAHRKALEKVSLLLMLNIS